MTSNSVSQDYSQGFTVIDPIRSELSNDTAPNTKDEKQHTMIP
jgi:hypothetical protein